MSAGSGPGRLAALTFLAWVAQTVLVLFAGVLFAALRANGRRPQAARGVGRAALAGLVVSVVAATAWVLPPSWAFWGPTWPLLAVLVVGAALATIAALAWGVLRYVGQPAARDDGG